MELPEISVAAPPSLVDVGDPAWLAFVAAQPRANIFHHPAWSGLLARCYGYRPFAVVVRGADGSICAGLPMMETNSPLTGRRWVALPFTDHCAALSNDEASLERLAGGLFCLAQERQTPKVEIRWVFPSEWAAQSTSPYVLNLAELGSNVSAVASRLHPTHRRNISVAEKKGVRIQRGNSRECLTTFYHLHLNARHRLGLPVQPWRFFARLGHDLLEHGLGFVLLAYKDGQCLAGAVFLHYQQTLTYKYAASNRAGLPLCPNNLLVWTAMRWGCENGYTLFDLGRTDLANAGLRKFKRGWGSKEMPLAYSNWPAAHSQPATGPFRPALQSVLRRSPRWVCRAAGELLYKHFG